MTISSLLKKVLGVNGIIVDDVKFEATVSGEQMVVQGHATRHEQRRYPVCGRKCPLYDHGRGVRRWRALDMGSSMKVFIASVSTPMRFLFVRPEIFLHLPSDSAS